MRKVLFAITGLLIVTAINAQSLEEIVDRYSKANMFDKLEKLSTMKITAKMSMPSMGVELPMQLWMKNPDKIRQVTSFNGQDIISTFNGTKGYTLNPMTGSTTPVEMSADEVKQAKTNMVFKNTLKESLKAGKLTLVGEETVNNRPSFKIKAEIEGIPSVIYIDKETYLVTKQSITASQGGMTMTVDSYPGDYREVNGLILPMKTSTSLQGMEAQIIYEKIEVNVPMEDSIFTLK